MGPGGPCKWQNNAKALLAKAGLKEPTREESFACQAAAVGINARIPHAAREVKMCDTLLVIHGAKRLKGGVFDASQSLHMSKFRSDGLLCCLSTGSRPYSMVMDDYLTVRERCTS